MKLNVKKRQYSGRRQKRLHDLSTWSNASHIMLLRQRALARVFVQGAQRWPVFYAFDEAIRFCVKAYNSSVSYILLGGGRERDVPSTGHAKQRSSLRVLDVEERRREVQVRFRDVRRPERAAVADRLTS